MSTTTLSRELDHFVGRFQAMASPCELLIDSEDGALARSLLDAVSQCAWRIEHKFSRYRTDSVVHRINQSNGEVVHVDEETAKLLDYATTLTQVSEGRFDITSGVLRKVWTFDGSDRVPTQEQIDTLWPFIGWDKVEWKAPKLRLRPGMQIDFGGIGKEYAVDLAADIALRIAPNVSCVVNFGGDVAVRNQRRDNQPWRVGVEHAERVGSAALIVNLVRGAVATSGDARRFVLKSGARYSHILDARTGWPVMNAPHAVTVMGDSCIQAGTLTTLAMLQGANAGAFLAGANVRYWLQ